MSLKEKYSSSSNKDQETRKTNNMNDDRNTKYLYSIGGRGSKPGQLFQPHGMAIHKHKIYVADTGNNRIQCFTYVKSHNKEQKKNSWGDWHVECMFPDPYKMQYGQWQNSVSKYDVKTGKRKTLKKHKNKRSHRLHHEFLLGEKRDNNDPHRYNSLLLNPEDICIDSLGLCIVADTGHHCIRIFGIEEEEIDNNNIAKEQLLSVEEFALVPLALRWKYKHHISKDNNGRPQFYRSVPNHRFVLLATWGGVASNTPGFFRFPRSICTFDWLMNENIDRHFDVKKAKNFVHNLAVLDSGNDRVQFFEYHRGEVNDQHTFDMRMENQLDDGERLIESEDYKKQNGGGGCCTIS